MRNTGYMRALAIFVASLASTAQAQSSMEHGHGDQHHHHAAPAQPQASSPAPAAPKADPHAGHHHAGQAAEGNASGHVEHHTEQHGAHNAESHTDHHAGHGAADNPASHTEHEAPGQAGHHADHDGMQGGSAPPDARDPHAYSNGLKRGEGVHALPGVPRLMMADEHRFASLRVDKLERRFTRKGEDSTAYEVRAWYGGTYDRLVLTTEGDIAHGKLEESRTELMWSHAISAYWDTRLGASLDTGEGPNRQWLAFGVEGLAPYWFDVEATAYLGSAGRTALRLEASYELLLSQELTLEPKIEMAFFGKNDPANQIGHGLSEASVGLRLRYEFTPRFAPYIGVERSASFGRTADYIRADGGRAQQTRFVAGLRFWF